MADFIQSLKGYHNSNIDLLKPGIVIGWEGRPYDLFNLTEADVTLEIIARCLSREARYVGNTEKFYSVGQHVVTGAEAFLLMGRPDLAKIYMLHDASESILRDMTKPVKNTLKDYEALQEEIDKFIAKVYKLPWPYPPEIKAVDKNAAQYEMTFMMHRFLHTDYWEPDYTVKRFFEAWNKINYLLDTYYK